MKKIMLFVLCAAILMLSSCHISVNISDDKKPESTIPTTTTQKTTTPTTTVNEEELMYAKLAQLTKEDGSGEINVEMTVDEIVAVFDKYDIKYDDYVPDGEYASGYVSVGKNSYVTNFFYGYGNFKLQQTYKGLKIGDKVEKVIELYGEPNQKKPLEFGEYYIYTQKKLYKLGDIYNTQISLRIQVLGETVTAIFVGIEEPLEQLYG